VLYMKMGLGVEAACQEAMRDLQPLLAASGGYINLLAIDQDGHPFGITSKPGGESYLVMTEESGTPRFVEPMRFSTQSTP